MFDVKLFSERLKAARTAKHISQADLAKAVGVSAATISSYETVNGAKIPSLDKAEAIANELGVSLDWLCGHETNDIVDTRKIMNTFLFLLSNLDWEIDTDPSHFMCDNTAYALAGKSQMIRDFLEEYSKIEPILKDDKIPDYLKNGLVEALYSKFSGWNYEPQYKDFFNF